MLSSIILVFLRKVVKQNETEGMSFCMQLEKVRRGLLREAFQSERECLVSRKRGGLKRKDRSWKMEVNIGELQVNKNECSKSNCVITNRILLLFNN